MLMKMPVLSFHIASNNLGHVLVEYDDLVKTLRNAGFTMISRRVDVIMNEIIDDSLDDGVDVSDKVIRSRWCDSLRRLLS